MTYYNEKGFKRFFNAIIFSYAGLKAAWQNEEAFRQEVIIFLIAVPLALWVAENNLEKLILISSIGIVLVTELLNSAIEAVVDKAGFEYHELAKRAKDMGSAAVMVSILMSVAAWLLIIF